MLELVQHLTDGERYWFGYHVAGDEAGADADILREQLDGETGR